MVDRESRVRAALRAETEHVTVSPEMRRRIDARLRRGLPTRTRLLVLSTAVVLVMAGAWFVSGGRTVRRDVYAPPTPTPAHVEGPMGEAEAAFRCFIEARRVRDIEAAKSCTTNRYQASLTDPVQFIGASSPGLERATIVSSSQRVDRIVFDVLLYWGRVEFVSEDTIAVVREGDRWLVDRWAQGEHRPVDGTTEVTLYFVPLEDAPVCDGKEIGRDAFIAVNRSVPSEVVVDDLVLSVVREALTGPWSHEGVAARAVPAGFRVTSVSIDESQTSTINLNQPAPRLGCPYGVALQETIIELTGLEDIAFESVPAAPSPEPDV